MSYPRSLPGRGCPAWAESAIIEGVKVVKQGTQSGGQHRTVQIIGLDYDFWYQDRLTRSVLREDETPLPPGDNGMLYYVVLREMGDFLVSHPRVDTEAFATVEEATAEAESLVVGALTPRVIWDK